MLHKLKKSTNNYLSALLVAYLETSEYITHGNKKVLLQLIAAILQFYTRVTHFIVYFCSRDTPLRW